MLPNLLAPFFRMFGKDLVLFLETHRGSGSNVFALYRALVNDPRMRYEVQLVRKDERGVRAALRRELLLAQAKWIVQDHGGRRRYPGQKVIELWHGIPIKTMDLMDISDKTTQSPLGLARSLPDLVLSSSRLYETLLSACRGVPACRYRRFGFPRLRWLQTSRTEARGLMSGILGQVVTEEEKVILWMPTHRRIKSSDDKRERSVIPSLLKNYLNDEIERALELSNTRLVLKPHPNDEPAARALIRGRGSRVQLLTGTDIHTGADDLYCMLPGTDALITDYSSVYLDYLLLDRPIGFMLDDLEQYRNERGFLLEPVTDWMPGHHILNSMDLSEFLKGIVDGQDKFQGARNALCQTLFPDGILDTAGLVRDNILK